MDCKIPKMTLVTAEGGFVSILESIQDKDYSGPRKLDTCLSYLKLKDFTKQEFSDGEETEKAYT